MNSFFSLNSLKIFSLTILMVLATVVYATEGHNDNNKNSQKDTKNEQVEQDNAGNEVTTVDAAQNEEPATDEEGVSISSVSFNFVFYLIYKIKYADIFKIVNRRQDESNSSGWSRVNLNQLYQKLAPPAI